MTAGSLEHLYDVGERNQKIEQFCPQKSANECPDTSLQHGEPVLLESFPVANGEPDGKCSANHAANPICTKRKPEERNNRIHVNSFLVEKNAVPENSARYADGGLRFLNVSNWCLKGGIIKVGIIGIRTRKFVDKFL